jgi:GT2 family glycosyltransferase
MSFDGTRRLLHDFEKRFPRVRVLDNPERLASAGLNRAIREARGEIIVRMDAHTIYSPDYVRSCVEVLNETNAENVGGPARSWAKGYVARAIAHGFHSRFATGGASFRNARYEGLARSVPYGCWRKSTLESIGLFDSELVRGQDDELNFRIVSSGGRIWQSPKIVSWYQPRSSLKELFWQFFQNGFWKVSAIRKHKRPANFRNLVPALCVLIVAALLAVMVAAQLNGSTRWAIASRDACLALAGLYVAGSLISSVSVARREGWIFLPIMPLVFAVYQFSYGLGFLSGILFRPLPAKPAQAGAKLRRA